MRLLTLLFVLTLTLIIAIGVASDFIGTPFVVSKREKSCGKVAGVLFVFCI
jgi:hypothetical protein